MSPANCSVVQKAVQEAGIHLKGKLPLHAGLSQRNPWAHLWERIKHHMCKSYMHCDDDELEQVLEIVAWYRNNPC